MINDFMENLKFTDGIAASDIIGWILAALAGFIAYKLIDNMQTNMERHNMVTSIEDSFSDLYNSTIAISMRNGIQLSPENAEDNLVMVRSVLHDFTCWTPIYEKDNPNKLECKIINNQRYLHIRNDAEYDEWISTQALHSINLKVRRIEKMYKSNIIKRVDLSDMSREIVPLGISGRIEYIDTYYNDYDADCIGYLVMQTVVSCAKYNNMEIVNLFANYYIAHPDIHRFFESSRRIRPIMDYFALNTFKKLMKSVEYN